MSHIPYHHGGAEDSHNTFLVILRVHGNTIHLWPKERMQAIRDQTHSFRISCQNVDTHSDYPGSHIRVFVLSDPADESIDKCSFQDQLAHGEPLKRCQLATFMTGPMDSSRLASYAIDLAIVSNKHQDDCEKLGTAYLYLDPRFSTQGIQKTPIIATHNHAPIGQIQVDYLIVTNPVAYDQPMPRPDWLFKWKGLDAGHRGSGSGRRRDLPEELLENTIASFNYAYRHGADMCELDALVSADGVPVVYHDFDVDAVTAQQSSDQLGKFRVQVNEFTVKQLQDFRLLSLNDNEGCPYTLKVANQAKDNRPFPTLAQVLDQVDPGCGLNIEIKWPQLLESGKMEARKYREINDFVDRIIDVTDKHACNRRIILESFDADLVIMLRLKQNRFPIVFLSQGKTDRYELYMDMRTRCIKNGVYFAEAFDLAGVDIILEYYLAAGKKLVNFINSHNLVARGWGDIGEKGSETVNLLKEMGLQCVTYDKVDLIAKKRLEVRDKDV